MNLKVVPTLPSPNISFISVPMTPTLLKVNLFHNAIEEPFCVNGSIKNL